MVSRNRQISEFVFRNYELTPAPDQLMIEYVDRMSVSFESGSESEAFAGLIAL